MPPHRELADDHYVPDLEPLWQVAARPQIGTFRNRQLGDLAMNEHFVGIEINNLGRRHPAVRTRSEEHTSELQSLMRISYAVFCLKQKKTHFTLPYDSQLQIYSPQHHLQTNHIQFSLT